MLRLDAPDPVPSVLDHVLVGITFKMNRGKIIFLKYVSPQQIPSYKTYSSACMVGLLPRTVNSVQTCVDDHLPKCGYMRVQSAACKVAQLH